MEPYRIDDAVTIHLLTMEELRSKENCTRGYSKKDLAKEIGLLPHCFDYTLPQPWLDHFVATTGLDYTLVRSTCFTLYTHGPFGRIVSGLDTIQHLLDGA